ncbi:MAG: hypothetical protein V7L23_13235 [Nostoc sp.]|uniref:hypothetical protein n=1 Tax=Nostoc sp. TaxID=1180 RepID=UPI002FF365F9
MKISLPKINLSLSADTLDKATTSLGTIATIAGLLGSNGIIDHNWANFIAGGAAIAFSWLTQKPTAGK